MRSIRPLLPLLTAAGILLAGNGVQGSLITLRGAEEGFSPEFIGFLGSAYFSGFLAGCFIIPPILRTVGHIRAFSTLAAIAASSSILLALVVEPVSWLLLRFVMGACFSGLFTTIESWLNSGSSNADRGRVLSIYRVVDLVTVTSAQYLLPVFGIGGFALFGVLAIMTCLSLVPVSLGDRSQPAAPTAFRFNVRRVFAISPTACLGCISIGLTNSAFRLVGPLYAIDIGLSIVDVATFMSAGIVGGVVLQYPLGMLSDRIDRRFILLLATSGAVLSGLYLSLAAGTNPLANYIGIFMFGAFALPLYSLSAAHANDHAGKGGNSNDYVLIAAGLTFFFSIGAIIGPPVASALIEAFGPQALFTYTSTVHGALIALIVWRVLTRAPVDAEYRGRFVTLLRTSPQIFRFAKQNNEQKDRRRKE